MRKNSFAGALGVKVAHMDRDSIKITITDFQTGEVFALVWPYRKAGDVKFADLTEADFDERTLAQLHRIEEMRKIQKQGEIQADHTTSADVEKSDTETEVKEVKDHD